MIAFGEVEALPDLITREPKDRPALRKELELQIAKAPQSPAIDRPEDTTFCTAEVRRALTDIGKLRKGAAAAQASKKAGETSEAKGTGKGDADGDKPSPEAARAQAQIARIMRDHRLSRTFIWVWTPSRRDFEIPAPPGRRLSAHVEEDLFRDAMAQWFVDGGRPMFAKLAADPSLARLRKSIVASLAVEPWTVGSDYTHDGAATLDGVVYRDPALARLRVCLGACVPTIDRSSAPDVADGAGRGVAVLDLTNQTDDLVRLDVALPQLGRLATLSMRTRLFGTANGSVAIAADGTVTTVGTQRSNAAAAGLGGLSAAAAAASAAETARNSAVTAGNAALVSRAQFQDVRNSALADCLQKAAVAAALGGTPQVCQ